MLNVVTGCLKLLKGAKSCWRLLYLLDRLSMFQILSITPSRPGKLLFYLSFQLISDIHIKYKTFWHIHILSCLHYLALLKISIRMAQEHRSYSNQVERARSPLFCIVSLIFLQLNFLITKYYVLHIMYIWYYIPFHSSIHHNNPNQFNVKFKRPRIDAKSHLNIN